MNSFLVGISARRLHLLSLEHLSANIDGHIAIKDDAEVLENLRCNGLMNNPEFTSRKPFGRKRF